MSVVIWFSASRLGDSLGGVDPRYADADLVVYTPSFALPVYNLKNVTVCQNRAVISMTIRVIQTTKVSAYNSLGAQYALLRDKAIGWVGGSTSAACAWATGFGNVIRLTCTRQLTPRPVAIPVVQATGWATERAMPTPTHGIAF